MFLHHNEIFYGLFDAIEKRREEKREKREKSKHEL